MIVIGREQGLDEALASVLGAARHARLFLLLLAPFMGHCVLPSA